MAKNGNGKRRNGNKSKRNVAATRVRADRVLAQAVGKFNPRPFQSDITFDPRQAIDATIPLHLPLPRPVAPYTVVRLTKRFKTSDHTVLIGAWAFGDQLGEETQWSNVVACSTPALAGVLGGSTIDWKCWTNPSLAQNATSEGLQLVPSAITVQVMNPNPLQTTTGIVYGTVMKQMPNWFNNTTNSVQSFVDASMQVNPPRLMSAGKLALRGVVAHLPPGNMNKLSDFRREYTITDQTGQFSSTGANPFSMSLAGFMPVLIYNTVGGGEAGPPAIPALELEYLVTTEYRVRFDPLGIAAASHKQYPMAPLSVWDRLVQTANAGGHQIQDIAEVVANVGNAVGAGISAGRSIAAAVATLPKV